MLAADLWRRGAHRAHNTALRSRDRRSPPNLRGKIAPVGPTEVEGNSKVSGEWQVASEWPCCYMRATGRRACRDPGIGGSSNGRTADSDSACLGSNPSPPANLDEHKKIKYLVDEFPG